MDGTNRFFAVLCLSSAVFFAVLLPCNTLALATTTCPNGVDIVFIMDRSGSVGGFFPVMVSFVEQLVTSVGSENTARFGLITYSDNVQDDAINLGAHGTTAGFVTALNALATTTGGETFTDAALARASDEFNSARNRGAFNDIAIIITDGKSSSGEATINQANLLKAKGVTIISIGVGLQADDRHELEAMATSPDYVSNVDIFEGLVDIIGDLCGAIVCASCGDHGECSRTSGGSRLCRCDPGYSGVNCEVNTDECASGPCQNESTCIDLVNSYSCNCTDGWSGQHCEIEDESVEIIDYCWQRTCNNKGQCYNDYFNEWYQCDCIDGFTGTDCEVNTDECASGPCQYESTCIDWVNSYSCICIDGWTGEHCGTEIIKVIDYCHLRTCNYHGNCSNTDSSYICDCDDGWTGTDCEAPCGLLGTCPDTFGPFDCGSNNPCQPLFYGNVFYYPAVNPKKFVQCSAHGQCWVMPCAPGTAWSYQAYTCIHSP